MVWAVLRKSMGANQVAGVWSCHQEVLWFLPFLLSLLHYSTHPGGNFMIHQSHCPPNLPWQPITSHTMCYTKTHPPLCILAWPLKVGPTDGPETLVTNYQPMPCNILQVQGLNNIAFKISMAFMLRIWVFWVVMVNSRVTDSWCSKRTCNLIFRGWEVLGLNPCNPRCYVPPKHQQSITLPLSITSQKT